MYKPQRGGGAGGWKGKKSFGDRDFARPEMFAATCAQCSKTCQVPFRPNGSKPVYCSNCFKRDGHESQSNFGGDSFRKPSFGDRRPFKPSFDREERSSGGSANIERQLKTINEKLDAIIEALES